MKKKLKIGQVLGLYNLCLAHPRPKRYMLWLFIPLVIALIVTAAPVVVYAQGSYPPARDPYVNDYAGVIEPQDVQRIQAILADLNGQANIHATVLTINSIKDYQTGDETIEAFATHLFNAWGIGDRATNKGVLILVAVEDRQVRIELGAGYESQYNAAMKEVIDEYMLPAFKNNEYSRGIYQGTRAAVAKLIGIRPPEEHSTANPISSESGGPGWLIAALFIGFFIASGFIVIALGRVFGWSGSGGSYGSSDDSRGILDSGSLSYRDSSSDSGPPSHSDSASDSGGSFDGGSSSGEGASGSW